MWGRNCIDVGSYLCGNLFGTNSEGKTRSSIVSKNQDATIQKADVVGERFHHHLKCRATRAKLLTAMS